MSTEQIHPKVTSTADVYSYEYQQTKFLGLQQEMLEAVENINEVRLALMEIHDLETMEILIHGHFAYSYYLGLNEASLNTQEQNLITMFQHTALHPDPRCKEILEQITILRSEIKNQLPSLDELDLPEDEESKNQ